MDRRDFLTSVGIGAAIAVAMPTFAEQGLKLYGDGIHDDTAALQNWINSDIEHAELSDKSFLISDTIYTPKSAKWRRLYDCTFLCAKPSITMFRFDRIEEQAMLLAGYICMMAPHATGSQILPPTGIEHS